MRKNDYSIRYYLANLICFIVLYVLCIWETLKIFPSWIIRAICGIVLFFTCSIIELKYLCYYVNYLVTLSLPKEVRKREMELLKKVGRMIRKIDK